MCRVYSDYNRRVNRNIIISNRQQFHSKKRAMYIARSYSSTYLSKNMYDERNIIRFSFICFYRCYNYSYKRSNGNDWYENYSNEQYYEKFCDNKINRIRNKEVYILFSVVINKYRLLSFQ